MAYFTELFMRPKPAQDQHYRAAMRLLNGMSTRDLADAGIRPADFPRIARHMTTKPAR